MDTEKSKEAAGHAKIAFESNDYPTAIKFYTEAISFNKNNHLLYSNRSACYVNTKQFLEALDDAKKCLELKPDFIRGYIRKGVAEFNLGKYEDAIATYEKGLEIDPKNEQLKNGLEEAKKTSEGMMFGTPQEILQKLLSNPSTKEYLKDRDFITKLQTTYGNPQALFALMRTDPRFVKVFHLISGIPMSEIQEANLRSQETQWEMQRKSEEEAHFREMQEKEKARMEAERKMSEEERLLSQMKQKAEEEKLKGNEAYKAKKLDIALEHYEKAISFDPKESIYHLNKASVFLEQKKFDECLKECNAGISLAEQTNPRPLEKIGKGYGRKGNCLMQMNKFQEALDAYEKSLLEWNDQNIKEAKKKCIELKKQYEEQLYIDPVKADAHKEAGNKLFRDGNFTAALTEYNEAIKRSPKNSVLFLNRALSYMKLLEHGKALEDIEKSLKFDPNYVKAYAKKGNIHLFLKEFHKALDAYNKGLSIEPTNDECLQGKQKTHEAMYQTPPSEERAQKSMADPEIRALMSDPRIIQMLKEMRENPQGMKPSTTDPFISQAIEKLIAAGILGVR